MALQSLHKCLGLLLAMGLTACAASPPAPAHSGGSSDMTNILSTLARSNPAAFEAVMDKFIVAAKAQDIEGMLALTSPETRKEQGDDGLRGLYRNEYVILFTTYPQKSAGGDVINVHDAAGNEGWVFKKVFSAADGRQAKVQVAVLREQGNIYVSAVTLWH